ncbi:TonB-dependent receptor [Sphingosinicella terrae]|uniref:TonB-dependent receptor n=1 Tax=Sphingosinicella terrae TaxID=2172047 RepID=UPI0013B36085|nr:TonB-dependent receptor [Sphingosinicella terrae]
MRLARNIGKLLASTSLVVSGAAFAQTASPQAEEATAEAAATADQEAVASETGTQGGLEEIVVTAQRRAENLQDIPLSVATVTADVAQQVGVTSPENVSVLVPSVTMQRQASGFAPFIRGVGSTSTFIGNEPSVAIFMDDMYIPTGNAAVFEFNNIEQVEVLKGPQGTLFGRNATGGVIHIRTRRPSYETTVDATIGYGNYDTLTAQLYASTGLSDNVAINISGFYVDQNDGWGRNVTDGRDVYWNESWGIRSRLLWEPSDRTEVLISGGYTTRRSDQGMASRVAPGFFGFAGYSPEALGADFYDGAYSAERGGQFYDTEFWSLTGRVSHEFDNATLVSITSYSETDTYFEIDLDAAPANILSADVTNWAHTFTQEIQLLSSSDSDVRWIIGGYFMKDTSRFSLEAFGLGIPAAFGPGARQLEQAQQDSWSISGFAQATYEILPRTNLTIGLRYTSDHREETDGGAAIVSATGAPLVVAGPFSSDVTFSNLTGRFAIDYQVTDDFMVYAAFNRGFKSGVYNLPGYSVATGAPLPPVEPEELDAYSIGFKSEFWNRRIRLNVEGFYYDFTNIQFQNNVPPPNVGTILSNAGAATIKGVDIDLSFAPTDRLTISASASIIDGEYDEFPDGPTFFPLPPNAPIAIPAGCGFTAYPTGGPGVPMAQRVCDLSGNNTVNTAPFSSTVSLLYNLPTINAGEFDFVLSWNHGGGYYTEPDNLSFARQPKYDLVNASIRWTAPSENYDLRLWVNNIFEEEYYAYIQHSGTSGTKYSPAAPRTYGITLGVHF